MSLISPTDRYHAELRQQLGTLGRALALQRGLRWLPRGVLLGLLVDCSLVSWDWTRGVVLTTGQSELFIAMPAAFGLAAALASLVVRPDVTELARQVDRVAALHERSVTALELGQRRAEHPLAVAQMRDTVEHLRRLDPFRAFAPRLPRRELIACLALAVASASIALSPNPWLAQRVAALGPAAAVAVDQAQRITRLAESLPDQSGSDTAALRDTLDQGAAAVQSASTEPESALQALNDLQSAIAALSAGDSQLNSALGAAANSLANAPGAQALASALRQGDPRASAQAMHDLAQQIGQMTPDQQAQLAQALSAAAAQARAASPQVADQLSAAAQALSNASAGAAQQALDNLANSAGAAADRQRAADQVQSSQSALARALGTAAPQASPAGTANRRPGQQSGQQTDQSGQSGQAGQAGQSGQNSQAGQSGQSGQSAQSGQSNQGAAGDQGSQGAEQSGQADQAGQGDGSGQGSGYSTGGQTPPQSGAPSRIDASGQIQRVPNPNQAPPDQSSLDPSLAPAPSGAAHASQAAVNPAYSSQSTQANGSPDIPQGLRDLVRDYFSSQPQAQPQDASSAPAPDQSSPPPAN